jgi:hypothetical protein
LETPLIFNNVAEVVLITTVLLHIAVLGDASSRVVSSQAPVRAEGRSNFTSGTPCPIIMALRRFSSENTGRLFCYDQVRCFGPCCARRARGEPSGAIRWMVSMIDCTRTTLKYGFKFRISHVLGVQASDASDLPMVGYPLELWRGWSSFGATIQMRRLVLAELSQVLTPISG